VAVSPVAVGPLGDVSRTRRRRAGGWMRSGLAATLSIAFVLVAGQTAPATADDLANRRKQTQAQIEANTATRAQLDASLEDLSADLADAVAAVQTTQAQLPAAQQKVDDANAALAAAQRESERVGAELADARAQERTLAVAAASTTARASEVRAAIGTMARRAYQTGAAADASALSAVLDASDSQDFVKRFVLASAAQRTQQQVLDQLQSASAEDRNAQVRLAAVRTRIDGLKADADQTVLVADQAATEAGSAKAQLDRLVAVQAAQQSAVEGRIEQAKAEQAQVDAAQAQLGKELASIVAQQAAQAASSRPTSPRPPAPASAGAWFVNPTANSPIVVTSPYGMRLQPILKIWRLHAGIDLEDRCNQPVYAGRDGTVLKLQTIYGDGNRVVVDHGWVNGASLMTAYNHLNTFAVSAGQAVKAGQVLGYAGMTGGVSTGCHLDFQVFINGATTDPAPYLGL